MLVGGVGYIVWGDVDRGEDAPCIVPARKFGRAGYGLLDQECLGD